MSPRRMTGWRRSRMPPSVWTTPCIPTKIRKPNSSCPNDTWLRTGGSTQLQLIALKRDVTEVDLASGIARFYNRSTDGVIKVTTEFGYVVAGGKTTFDLYVGDESVEVVALSGEVDFIHAGNQAKYPIAAGSSLIADGSRVSSAQANVDAVWDDWNVDRDRLWRSGWKPPVIPVDICRRASATRPMSWKKTAAGKRSVMKGAPDGSGVPPESRSEWSPFTAGRWTDYHGDSTWIPDRAVRLRHPSLRQLDIYRQLLVLGTADGRFPDRHRPVFGHRSRLVSRPGRVDPLGQRDRLGAAGLA